MERPTVVNQQFGLGVHVPPFYTGVFIESEADHTMDLNDMEAKIRAHPEAKFMLVSHMRGKLCDMDRVKEMCEAHGITMVEDCAHSVGVFWGEEHTGHHGIAACFSTQSHKAINSGEGGFLCTGMAVHPYPSPELCMSGVQLPQVAHVDIFHVDDEDIAAKAIVAAGGYEKFFMSHITAPGAEVFERIQPMFIPNYSVRMSALTAATIRPQIQELPTRIEHANRCYELICNRLMSGAAEVCNHTLHAPCNLYSNLIAVHLRSHALDSPRCMQILNHCLAQELLV